MRKSKGTPVKNSRTGRETLGPIEIIHTRKRLTPRQVEAYRLGSLEVAQRHGIKRRAWERLRKAAGDTLAFDRRMIFAPHTFAADFVAA